jgi:manganese/zinc/iron transport system permease protein
METGNAAGLSSFIYGKTASMIFFDAMLIASTALVATVFCLIFFKEFSVVCFDHDFAATQGWPVGRLDFMMMTLVVIVTVVGLQAVGLILVVALLIIPPATARFWTYQLKTMLLLSGLFGALSGLVGSGISALMANLPAGAVIVLSAATVFLFSMIFGTARGLLRKLLEHVKLRRKITKENLLREMYEFMEYRHAAAPSAADPSSAAEGISFESLLRRRSWSAGQLQRTLARLQKDGLSISQPGNRYRLTEQGTTAAARVVRKHRLWETYLLTHADVAPGQVDWGADEIEHVLDREMIERLEALLPDTRTDAMPPSPHRLRTSQGAV